VLRKVLGNEAGPNWCGIFLQHIVANTFLPQIPDEFIHYLKNERGERAEDPADLQDLAHYEWVELMLSVSNKEIDYALIDPKAT